MEGLTREELSLLREWYNCIKDLNCNYLEEKDKKLYLKILKRIEERK